jgi:hypothetical protein
MIELTKWLGVTKDSRRPNVGALLLVVGAALYAMGYKPEDVSTWGAAITGMSKALAEFLMKPDNAIGTLLGGAGLAMLRGREEGDFTADETSALRAELSAMRVRRELSKHAPDLET